MADIIIRPTRKWVRIQYWIVILICCVAIGIYVNKLIGSVTPWLLVIPALLFYFPVRADILQRFTKITISGDRLHYETGIASKTTRTIQISKVQDVRVDQSLLDRIMRIGHLTIETAGETSRLTVDNIDDPQVVADEITDAAQGQAPKSKSQKERG